MKEKNLTAEKTTKAGRDEGLTHWEEGRSGEGEVTGQGPVTSCLEVRVPRDDAFIPS